MKMEETIEKAQSLTDDELRLKLKEIESDRYSYLYNNVYVPLVYVIEASRRTIDKLNKENDNLKKGNLQLKRENEELKNHIHASPDGELYFSARDHYKISLQEFQ